MRRWTISALSALAAFIMVGTQAQACPFHDQASADAQQQQTAQAQPATPTTAQ